jgi:hypothetical protein
MTRLQITNTIDLFPCSETHGPAAGATRAVAEGVWVEGEVVMHVLDQSSRRQMMAGFAASALAAPAFAQSSVFRDIRQSMPLETLSVPIPAAVIAAVKAAPNRRIFNVSTNEIFADQILKADELVLSQDAILTMTAVTNSSTPWVAIAARRWKFLAPQKRALIRRDQSVTAATGGSGGVGSTGPNGPSDNTHGSPGGQGSIGATGGTRRIAPIYLFGEKTVDQPGNPIPWMNLVVLLPGIMGGTGGTGGLGGRGGNGASGNPGSDAIAWCNRGPGDGGNGGRGGQGGFGGFGGTGGDGGQVVYAGPQAFLDIITFANLINVPGDGGLGGQGGRGGQGGSGGPRGSNTTYCHGGTPGRDGGPGPFGSDGTDGRLGQKGNADVSLRPNLDDLY